MIYQRTKFKLSGNHDFYNWLTSRGPSSRLPENLDRKWRQMTEWNMESNLRAFYRWISGRGYSERGFLNFLISLVNWYSGQSGGNILRREGA
mmetsp:Transcript_16703/g.21120  ORF Transcript_16703/g.21120 Transcript_16703/m.21120 type:complete len:92 (-) Transcript_16703:112-387(-)